MTALALSWFAVAGGLAAWTIQLLASYALIDFGCARAGLAPGPPAAVLVALSILCAAIALGAALVARRRAMAATGAARALFTGGLLLDALALITIAFGAVLPFAFAPCL